MPRFARSALACLLVLALATPFVWADDGPTTAKAPNPRVLIKTNKGDITAELFADAAPETVRVFLGLAQGAGTYTDVKNKQKKVTLSKPFYDGLVFHRVIPGFMIQGGCPRGQGTGGPGFAFRDEIDAEALGLHKQKVIQNNQVHPWIRGLGPQYWQRSVLLPVIQKLKINPQELNASKELQGKVEAELKAMTLKQLYEMQGYTYTKGLPSRKPIKGSLALANSGPDTNGSQFFINLGDTPHLTGRHTVFGHVIKGMDIVEKIGAVKTANTKPVEPVRIISIRRLP